MKEHTQLAIRLYEHMKAMPIADFAATSAPRELVPTNLTEYLLSSDKMRLVRLMNCDEKYRNGQASDFELFQEWERIMPLCPGYGAAELYGEEKRFLGIESISDPREAWKKGNETVCALSEMPDCRKGIHLNQEVMKIAKSNFPSSIDYTKLSTEIVSSFLALQSNVFHVIADFGEQEYSKPDPYHAALAFRDIICDEKNNIKIPSILLAQLLIDLLLAAKKQGKATVVLHLRGRCAWELLLYLAEHRLLPEEARMGLYLNENVAEFSKWFMSVALDCRILPELILAPSDFGCSLVSRLCTLAESYPLGGIRFGGVQTDSAAVAACHDAFDRSFATALATLCQTEAQAMNVMHVFFS